MQTNKTRALTRAAGVVMLVTLIITCSANLISRVICEIYNDYFEGSVIGSVIRLFEDVSAYRAVSLLYNVVMPVTFMIVGAVIDIIIIKRFFSGNEKQSGIIIIVSAAVSYCNTVATVAVADFIYIPLLHYENGLPLYSDIRSFALSFIVTFMSATATVIPVILLGLLLIGVFKKASKVVGFVLIGCLAVSAVLSLSGVFSNIVTYIRLYNNGELSGIVLVITVISVVSSVWAAGRYIAYMLCSLGIALKPREKTEIPQDSTVTS